MVLFVIIGAWDCGRLKNLLVPMLCFLKNYFRFYLYAMNGTERNMINAAKGENYYEVLVFDQNRITIKL